jgi:hypothetical protein
MRPIPPHTPEEPTEHCTAVNVKHSSTEDGIRHAPAVICSGQALLWGPESVSKPNKGSETLFDWLLGLLAWQSVIETRAIRS